MKTVQRSNKQLRVADDRMEDMRKAGYVEVDSKTGKPVAGSAAEPDAAALKRENAALKKENKDLRAQIKALSAQVEAMEKPPEG